MAFRVVYIDHIARMSGGEIALLRVLPALRGHVHAHVILGEDGPLVERLTEAGISVEVIPMDASARDFRKDAVTARALDFGAAASSISYGWLLRQRLRDLKPDLVHTNSLKAALYGGAAARLAAIPVVWHIRDRIAPDYLPRSAIWLVRAASRVLPTAVIANSRSTLSTLPHPRRPVVVADAVDLQAVVPHRSSADDPPGPLRIGMVGRLAPWKGQHIFLEAFSRAFPSDDSQAVVIGSAMFGEDDYAAQLTATVRRLGLDGRVFFRGFVDDVWSELAHIDILVHCSLVPEPFGQVVVEGMAAGVPVIAAAAGGPAEIITDGVDGILTRPGDVDALGAALRRLHGDPDLRRTMATRGRLTAAEYSPERTAGQILAVYEEIIGRRRRSP